MQSGYLFARTMQLALQRLIFKNKEYNWSAF